MNSNYKYTTFTNEKQITDAVRCIAKQIETEYKGKQPILIGVLKGAFIFMADLVRAVDLPLEVDFISVSSYGDSTESCGKVKLDKDISSNVTGRDVIIVEDIIDTGITTTFIKKHIEECKPASLKICCLLDKPSRRTADIDIDYKGITVPDKFLIGYGLDYGQKHRNLNTICCLEFEDE